MILGGVAIECPPSWGVTLAPERPEMLSSARPPFTMEEPMFRCYFGTRCASPSERRTDEATDYRHTPSRGDQGSRRLENPRRPCHAVAAVVPRNACHSGGRGTAERRPDQGGSVETHRRAARQGGPHGAMTGAHH